MAVFVCFSTAHDHEFVWKSTKTNMNLRALKIAAILSSKDLG